MNSTQPVFRRQASPSDSGPELNSPSRDTGFFRAGTEPARSALHLPDPRLFAIASSLHLNSFVILPWFDIATDLPRFVCGLAVVRDGPATLYGAATPRYAASDYSLGEAAVFPWIPSVEVQSFAPPPQRLLVKIVTRDVTRCLDDTHIFLTNDRIEAPGMCISVI